MNNKQTALYRHYAQDGTLLYVGISLSAVHRLGQHKDNAHWYCNISRVDIEQFKTRGDALLAEKTAIQQEHPLHNIKHQSLSFAINSELLMVVRGGVTGMIVKSNELIEASYALSLAQSRLLHFAISIIDRRKSFTPYNLITIDVKDYADCYRIDKSNAYTAMRAGAKALCDCKILFKNGDVEKWVSRAEYIVNESRVILSFTSGIAPHLYWM